jgi:hypothetical protein
MNVILNLSEQQQLARRIRKLLNDNRISYNSKVNRIVANAERLSQLVLELDRWRETVGSKLDKACK